ncbi:hypothetical protein MYX75_10110 [Acidobacteria bacterium AH-259-A15]|nr:hypothetical protein [Acidobacteria bacterium AH-259-A15]
MKNLFMLFAGILLPVIIIWSLTKSPKEVPLEWELAVVNAEARVPVDHPTVSEFGGLLDRLERKCSNSRREITEVCIAAHYFRKERGSLDTLLEFTSDVDEAIPKDLDFKMDVKKVVRAMITR